MRVILQFMNNDILKNRLWKVGTAVGLLLGLFLLVISIKEIKSIKYVGKDTPIMNVITVNGKGEIVSIPDIAAFSFSVTETSKMVYEAQTKATTKINTTLKILKDNGIEEKDIKTLSYEINPRYEYLEGICLAGTPCRPGRSVITGYNVSQTIGVKVRDLKKVGTLFSAIGTLGVQNISSLSFSIDDIEEIKAEARDLAIENAKEKAQVLAKQLGVRLGRITSFYDSSDDQYGLYGREGMGSDIMTLKSPMAVSPEIPTGEQKVTSKVSITYEIR